MKIVVAYRKRKNGKVWISKFDDSKFKVDDILKEGRRVPVINDSYEILEVGIGKKFEQIYKEKYNG